jgi:flagellar basal-body rod protein FlgB
MERLDMSNSFLIDPTIQAATAALDGLSARQQVIGRNLANVDTPGYHAQTINFEDALKGALQGNDKLPLATTNAAHLASPTLAKSYSLTNRPGGSERADQNNVDIETELTDMSQTGIMYEAVSQSVTKKLALLNAIASDR